MIYDVIIIGAGPAGLTAAVYARRANKTALVIEKGAFGGQITFSPKVENIPGFTEISGNEFAEKMVDQALFQGVEFESCTVTAVQDGEVKTVVTDEGTFKGRTVIVATGARHRTLGLPGEENFIGNGISFCAVCDGAFYKGQTVGVVGGGNSALQEALLLSELCQKVYVIQNLDFLTGEAKLCEQLAAKENVEIITGTTVQSLLGEDAFGGVSLRREADGQISELALDGLFVAIGLVPQNEAFRDLLPLDKAGYIVAGEDGETGVAGIFAAGDCRTKTVRQLATAAADGAVCAVAACRLCQ